MAGTKRWMKTSVMLMGILLGPAKAPASDLPPDFTQAVMAVQANDCPGALKFLEAVLDPPPDGIRPRVLFVTGYCLLKTDQPAAALPLLEQAAAEYDLLADYATAYAAQAAQAIDDRAKTIALLSHLVTRYPSSLFTEEAQFHLAMAYLNTEQRADAEKILRAFLDRHPTSNLAPEAFLHLAKLYLSVDRPQHAVPLLKHLYIRTPTDPATAEAERLLKEIPHALTRQEHLLRIETLFQQGSYGQAATALTRLLQENPRDGDIRLLMGRILFAMKDYPQAIVTLHPLIDPTVRSSLRLNALFLMGRAALRSGKYAEAIPYLERITTSFRHSHLADDALHLIGINLEQQGEDAAALNVYARLIRDYPRGGLGDTARWRRAWLYYRQGNLAQAEHELQRILKDYPQSRQTAQVLYWRGRMLEEMGKTDPAHQMYQRLVQEATLDPYYEWRARERLGLEPRQFSSGIPPSIENLGPAALAKARELSALGIWEGAAGEYWEIATGHPGQIALQWEACEALTRANMFEKGVRIARGAVLTLLKDGRRNEALTTFGGCLYPRGFWPWVDQHVKETPLDPYLVTALIREESAFAPTAISRAGARGLMQLMPRTAARVAKEIDLSVPPDIDAPALNIALGIRYLAGLHEQFGGNLVLTLAAYNAGPHVVQRWLTDGSAHDLEIFVEQIPYRETREYVKRVLGTYDRYRSLYTGPE